MHCCSSREHRLGLCFHAALSLGLSEVASHPGLVCAGSTPTSPANQWCHAGQNNMAVGTMDGDVQSSRD